MPSIPTVLICDDSKVYRQLMSDIVVQLGYRCIGEAATGAEAVDQFKRLRPDLVLLDINMPVKTGVEALSEILTEQPAALVVMLTSVVELNTVEKCVEIGAVNYVLKDTAPPEIVATIRETWEAASEE